MPWAGDEPYLEVTHAEKGVMVFLTGDDRNRQLTAYYDVAFPATRQNRDDGILDNNRPWTLYVDNGRQVLGVSRNAGANALDLVTWQEATQPPYASWSQTIDDDDEARQLSASIVAALEEHATEALERTVINLRLPGSAYPYDATQVVYTWTPGDG